MFTEREKQQLRGYFALYTKAYRATLPTEEELEKISFSERFERRMEKLIRRQRRFYYAWIDTVGKRVAWIAVGLLACLTVTTFSVDAIREPVAKFMVETYEKFSRIFVDSGTDQPADFVFVKAEPTYLPDGFVAVDEIDIEGTMYQVKYENHLGGSIVYTQDRNTESITITLDTEGAEYREIEINHMGGIIFQNKGETILAFGNEKYYFSVSGTVSEEEIVKIAESIHLEK